jgi:hypothetical protein
MTNPSAGSSVAVERYLKVALAIYAGLYPGHVLAASLGNGAFANAAELGGWHALVGSTAAALGGYGVVAQLLLAVGGAVKKVGHNWDYMAAVQAWLIGSQWAVNETLRRVYARARGGIGLKRFIPGIKKPRRSGAGRSA